VLALEEVRERGATGARLEARVPGGVRVPVAAGALGVARVLAAAPVRGARPDLAVRLRRVQEVKVLLQAPGAKAKAVEAADRAEKLAAPTRPALPLPMPRMMKAAVAV